MVLHFVTSMLVRFFMMEVIPIGLNRQHRLFGNMIYYEKVKMSCIMRNVFTLFIIE